MAKFDTTRFFQVRPAIYYGRDALKTLTEMAYTQVCIVTDPGMVRFGILKKLTDVLDSAGITYHVFDDVKPDPDTEIVEKGLVSLMLEKPQALIGLGGGSAIDSAKAIIYYGSRLQETFFGESIYKKPYFIAVPTTAGTGSEVTEYAVITDKERGRKIPLTSSEMMPDAAILDPRLIESVPPAATAATGLDVLTHAVEAYTAVGNNPFARCYAVKAAELVFKNLKPAYDNPADLDAKAAMQIASCMAGIAFNSAGLGIAHSLAHAIGAEWHLPHGYANALTLPQVIDFNGRTPAVAAAYAHLLASIGCGADNPAETLGAMVRGLKQALNLPASLKEAGISEEAFKAAAPDIVAKAMQDVCTAANAAPVSCEDMAEVLVRTHYGA